MFKGIPKKMNKKPQNIHLYLNENYEINPHKEALFAMMIFGVFGLFWIGLSDTLIELFVSDVSIHRKIQTFKGSVFVGITMMIIYTLVKSRASLFLKSINKIKVTYEDLQQTYDELLVTKEKLENTIHTDALTNLPNRYGLEQKVEQLIAEGRSFALVKIGIDNFKYINDTLGYAIGDQFLNYIGDKLTTMIETPHIVGRLGGDEFGIILCDATESEVLMKKFNQSLRNIWVKNNHKFIITISAGVVLHPMNGDSEEMLWRKADIAMNLAKKEGKGKVIFYKDEMSEDMLEKIDMVYKIKRAIEKEQFVLFYQPLIQLTTGEIIGFEALIRWKDQKNGYVSPAKFIPLAEETNQIFEIEKWVFKTALTQKQKFEREGLFKFFISINLSSKTLMNDENFIELEKLLNCYDVDYSNITIEITETAIISNIAFGIERLERLKKFGLRIALDDFGTGYSSLTHLKNFPIDIVKLDRSYIMQIEENSKDLVIIKAILTLSKDLNYSVVAEGIETAEQLAYLKAHHCDVGQGYFISRPLPMKEIQEKTNGSYQFAI